MTASIAKTIAITLAERTGVQPALQAAPSIEAVHLDSPIQPDQTALASRWILHPFLDYMLACGGLVWLLFGIHFFFFSGTDKGAAASALLTISSLGSLFLGEGHTAATLVRAYGKKELRQRHPILTMWVPIALCLVGAIGATVPAFTPILVKIYLLTVPQHFMAQSYGIARLYLIKHNYQINSCEKLALQMVTQCTIAFAILRQLTYKEWSGTTLLGQPVPFWGPVPALPFQVSQVLLICSLTFFFGLIIYRANKIGRTFPLPALVTLLTGVAAFTMGQAATGIFWLYVSAFFHATQYLVTVIACHLSESTSIRSSSERLRSLVRNSPATRLLGMILLVSVFIYIGVPRILEQLGCNYSLVFVSIFTTINFHHVLMDRVLWKLRRKEVRQAAAG